MKFISDIQDYIYYVSIDLGLSKATVENYGRQLSFFIEFLNANGIDINSFNDEHLHSYIQYIQKKKELKAQTIDLIITVIKSFLKYQQINKFRSDDPLVNFESPKLDKRIPKVLSSDTMKRILAAPDENIFIELRDKAMMEILYATGLRSSELINLKFSNINFSDSNIRVIGKGNKERMVPLALVTLDLLKKYIAAYQTNYGKFKTEYVFVAPKTGLPLSRQNLYTRIKFYAEKIGLNPIPSAHIFRHAFATHLLNNGADLSTVQLLLGHSSLNTTEIYTHVASKRIHKIFEKAHPRP